MQPEEPEKEPESSETQDLVRVRIVLQVEGSAELEPEACGLFAFGEVEDYAAKLLPPLDPEDVLKMAKENGDGYADSDSASDDNSND